MKSNFTRRRAKIALRYKKRQLGHRLDYRTEALFTREPKLLDRYLIFGRI